MLTRIGLVQVNSTADPARNLELVEEYTARAARAGARLVIFPEAMMRRFGGNLTAVAEPVHGPWAEAVRASAARHGVTVVAGMFTPVADGRVRNTLLITGGGVDTHYDKIHLYDAFGFTESSTVAPGEQPVLAEIDGTAVGFATCYDLRFPGLFQRLAADGADLVVVAASWGDGPGKVDQWRLLTRARALDATVFVAACGQSQPTDPGNTTAPLGVGHSAVVAPEGSVVAELGPAPDLLVTDIDPGEVDRWRKTLPVLANRRL
ncbi:carbon-nitrogen hydrolase family protein [Nocardia panacis]|uniref:Carbon-nitrogen hydrolase family protein n=1 Tax=Nocardia panacis TaxID=2340916 RepID=A0A3A4KD50_9NOCA|nr:carbon-nitrogen hydrolase family protein [Nocardia panacis]RJO73375.1 carbon-nitrogen hydrolase family protein [Nocardia panacis]